MRVVGFLQQRRELADASERFTAAGSQMEQARTITQARLVTQTAMEGLHYVRAAREAMGMDPGPALPEMAGQKQAGAVSEDRQVTVEGHQYAASPQSGAGTPYYYPGGMVAGRPVPRGWYSEPWWKPALVAGAWGVGTFLLMDAMSSGMHGIGDYGMGDMGMGDMGMGDLGGAADVGDAGRDWRSGHYWTEPARDASSLVAGKVSSDPMDGLRRVR